jgi:hypothetical protein
MDMNMNNDNLRICNETTAVHLKVVSRYYRISQNIRWPPIFPMKKSEKGGGGSRQYWICYLV